MNLLEKWSPSLQQQYHHCVWPMGYPQPQCLRGAVVVVGFVVLGFNTWCFQFLTLGIVLWTASLFWTDCYNFGLLQCTGLILVCTIPVQRPYALDIEVIVLSLFSLTPCRVYTLRTDLKVGIAHFTL